MTNALTTAAAMPCTMAPNHQCSLLQLNNHPMTSPTSSSFPKQCINLDAIKVHLLQPSRGLLAPSPFNFYPCQQSALTICNHTAPLPSSINNNEPTIDTTTLRINDPSTLPQSVIPGKSCKLPLCIDLSALKWCIHQTAKDIWCLSAGIPASPDITDKAEDNEIKFKDDAMLQEAEERLQLER